MFFLHNVFDQHGQIKVALYIQDSSIIALMNVNVIDFWSKTSTTFLSNVKIKRH